jgi:hypothetical protein
VEGRCDAVLITAQESSPSAIVTDAVGVYWVNGLPNGGLSGAQHGGAARRLVNDPNALRVAVDDNAVYWTSAESGFGAIRRALRGCDASPDCIESLPMSDRIFGIVVDATHIYFTAGQGNTNGGYVGALTKDAPLDAGFAFLAVNESNPVEIAVDDTSVYWTMSAGYNEFDQPNVQGAQRRAKTPSCTFTQDCIPQRLLRAPTWLGIAVDEKSLYLAISETNAGSILRVPRVPKEDAGSFDTIASGQPSPAAIAVDERFVYWVNRGAGSRTGSVMRIARDGSCPAGLPCPEVLIAPGSAASDLPSGIALHQKTIYFTTAGVGANNGAVWRIAK